MSIFGYRELWLVVSRGIGFFEVFNIIYILGF